MLINEVCKVCFLTKKAIEYYVRQELVSPKICENGYRDFSESDVEKLKKISILRKLDLGIDSIRSVLASESQDKALLNITNKKELELERSKTKIELIERLSQGVSWDTISNEIQHLSDIQTIMEKLIDAFPGYIGRFICLHFEQFLNIRISTDEQKAAYIEIVKFLDNLENFLISTELEKFLEEYTSDIPNESIRDISINMVNAVQDMNKFLLENKDHLEKYIVYKNSDEYKNSNLCKMQSLLNDFTKSSGYHEIFIENMKKISPKYKEYQEMLVTANNMLLSQYPEIIKWTKG